MPLNQPGRYLAGLQVPRRRPIIEEAAPYERDPIAHNPGAELGSQMPIISPGSSRGGAIVPIFNPEDYRVRPGPVGAQALADAGMAEPTAGPLELSPAAALVPTPSPAQAQPPAQPSWMTPERQVFYDKAKRAAQKYRKAVEQRRAQRKMRSDYQKLKGQYEREVGVAEDLQNMLERSPDLFTEGGAPNAQHMAIMRSTAKHVESATRLRQDLAKMREKLAAAGLADPDADDDDNAGFDEQLMGQGYADALATMP